MQGDLPIRGEATAQPYDVRAALDERRLEVWYQPKVEISTGRVVGVEALLRGREAGGQLRPVGDILAAADADGLMTEITLYVLTDALADCAAWRAEDLTIPVAVNVAAGDLTNTLLPAMVGALLDHHHLPGEMLTMEIVETAILDDPARTAEVLHGLRRLGVRLSADDFGVGYSCLSRLVQLPLTELKIDLGLVLGMHASTHGPAAVRAVIDLGHALGLRVVAEGVEDERTLRELDEARCDLAQGYLFSPPAPAPVMVEWVRGRHLARHRSMAAAQVAAVRTPASSTALRGLVSAVGAPVLTLASAALALYLAWQLTGWGGPERHTLIGDLAFVPVNLAAVLGCRAAARLAPSATRRIRRGWWFLAAGLGCYLAGNLLQCWYEVAGGRLPLVSWADPLFLGFYPLALVGLLQFASPTEGAWERIRTALDGAITALGGATVVWYCYLAPVATSRAADAIGLATAVAYPVGDLVLLFGVTTLVVRYRDPVLSRALHVLVAGLLAFLVVDLGYGQLQLHDAYHGGDLVDIGWFVALGLIGLAGHLFARTATSAPVPDRRPVSLRRSVWPYGAVTATYALLLRAAYGVAWYPLGGLVAAATAITALVAVRHRAGQREWLRLVERYQLLAASDELTGLCNRHQALRLADEMFGAAAESSPASLVMIDVDEFTLINNRYGQDVGDLVLRAVAESLRTRLRPADVAGRYGDDEFVVVLPHTGDAEAREVMDQVRARLHGLLVDAGTGPVPATLSIGIAESTGCQSLDVLLARADTALRSARGGRDRVVVYPPADSPRSPRPISRS